MRDALGPGTTLGYCTNVHAGRTLDEAVHNLETHALEIKRRVSPEAPMGVGLWFSARAARELLEAHRIGAFRDRLTEQGLIAYTLNGFPHGDFHQQVVKHAVYEPDWRDPERLRYTLDLAQILSGLLAEGEEGSISTLPLGWGTTVNSEADFKAAASGLIELSDHLHRLEQDTGRMIHVDLEPEPGCALDTSEDVARFFQEHLLGGAHAERIRRHIGVCHDVCHASVMFEGQDEALRRYAEAGLRVGKMQLSSAVRLELNALDAGERAQAIDRLGAFREERYLHQTTLRRGDRVEFFEDLPHAMREIESAEEARVHFHVPLFLESIGPLHTTSAEVLECLRAIRRLHPETLHFEIETYAWDVLPEDLRAGKLAEGIAREFGWLLQQAGSAAS